MSSKRRGNLIMTQLIVMRLPRFARSNDGTMLKQAALNSYLTKLPVTICMKTVRPEKQLVWDLPVRITHWLLVGLVSYAWFAVEILEDLEQHFLAGYGVLTLVLFRLVWGFLGTYHARFANFLTSPTKLWQYLKTFSDRHARPTVGHNPAGGLSALLMLLVLLLQTSTGLFNNDDYFFGPLSGLVDESTRAFLGNIHALNFDFAAALIALHVLAIVYYRIFKRQHLTSAMISGKKNLMPEQQPGITSSRLLLAIIVFLLCVAGVYYLATAFTDLLPASEYDSY